MFVESQSRRPRAEAAVGQIDKRRCPCPRCSGPLSDPRRSAHGWRHCGTCGCAWRKVKYGNLWYPVTIPSERCETWEAICEPSWDTLRSRAAAVLKGEIRYL